MPKFVYICALLSTRNELLRQLFKLITIQIIMERHKQSKACVGNKWISKRLNDWSRDHGKIIKTSMAKTNI